jgi:multidrug resistance efflux pump
MKRIVAILAVLVILVVGFLMLGNSRSAEGPPQPGGVVSAASAGKGAAPKGPPPVPVSTATVGRRDMRQVLQVTGSLKTDEEVQIGSRIAGKVVRVTVKEGDQVKRGQVVVQLDDRELRSMIDRARGLLAASEAKLATARDQATWKDTTASSDYQRARANVAASRSRLQQAQTGLKLVTAETESKVKTAQANLNVAKERLAITRETTRKQELAQAQLAVDQASTQLDQAKVDMDQARQVFERRQSLFKQDAIAREEVDEAERRFKSAGSTVRVAESGVSVARQRLDLAREGARPEEVRAAEQQVAAAEQALEQAQSDIRRKALA